MKREIEFRGLRADGKRWIEGVPHTYGDGCFMAQARLMSNDGKDWRVPAIEVIPETVGQYTGLKDKAGVKIFEGDYVNLFANSIRRSRKYLVVHDDCSWVLIHTENDGLKDQRWGLLSRVSELYWEMEVIGNIHQLEELK